MKVGFSSILEDYEASLEQWEPTAATVISCPSCKKKFYYHDFGENNAADACECENRNITISLVSFEDSDFKWYVGIRYQTEYPEFSEIPYDEYLKIKEQRKQNE